MRRAPRRYPEVTTRNPDTCARAAEAAERAPGAHAGALKPSQSVCVSIYPASISRDILRAPASAQWVGSESVVSQTLDNRICPLQPQIFFGAALRSCRLRYLHDEALACTSVPLSEQMCCVWFLRRRESACLEHKSACAQGRARGRVARSGAHAGLLDQIIHSLSKR